MSFRIYKLVAAITAVAISACSGVNQLRLVPQADLPATITRSKTTVLVVTLTIPRFSGNIRSRYVSPSTQSMRVQEGAKSLGIFETTKATRSCRSSSAGLGCRFTMAATAGKVERLIVTTYDSPKAHGSVLAHATIVRTIPSGRTTIPLALGGVPASIVVAPLPSATIVGDQSSGFLFAAGGSATLLISALDADGNLIIGSGAPKLIASVAGTGGLALTPLGNGNDNAFLLRSSGTGSGTLSVSATQNPTIVRISTPLVSGPTVTTFAGTPLVNGFANGSLGTGEFSTIQGENVAAYDASNSNLYIVDQGNCALRVANTNGTLTTIYGGAYSASDPCPHNGARYLVSLAYDSIDQNLYASDIYDVSSTEYCEISRISPTGAFTSIAGGTPCGTSADGSGTGASFAHAEAITFDPDNGLLYMIDDTATPSVGSLRSISTNGTVTTIAPVTLQNTPVYGLAYASGLLYTAERNWVESISLTGTVTLIAGGGQGGGHYSDGTGVNAYFESAWGIANDSHDGVLIVSDFCTIRTVTPSGVVTTVAGLNPVCSYLAAGNLGSQVLFQQYLPSLIYDSTHNVAYVVDQLNGVIRRLAL